MNDESPLVVVAGVIRRPEDGRILISQRPTGTHLPGLWEFPGGKVEAGESLEEGLRREIAEAIAGGLTVPQTAIELQQRFRNEERAIDYIALDRAQAGDIPAPSPEALLRHSGLVGEAS